MYIAELLTALGCECSHEDFFPKEITRLDLTLSRLGLKRLQWQRPPYGEAAWEAAPFLHLLPEDTVVFHQIRHPLDFVRSRQRKGLSRCAFRDRHLSVKSGASNKYRFWEYTLVQQVEYLTEFWIEWNALVEKNAGKMTYYRYRTDDISADLVAWMLDEIQCHVDAERVRAVYGDFSSGVNRGKAPDKQVSFDLLSPDLYERLEATCGRYGFEL